MEQWEKCFKEDSKKDSTWVCVCQWISERSFTKRPKKGFNMNMYMPVNQWNNERRFAKKTQIRIQHEYIFANVLVEQWEKFYKEDSNEDSTYIWICLCISVMVREVLQRRLENSTWICIYQSISGIVSEVLQKRLTWGFNLNMYLSVYQWNVGRSLTKKTQMRIHFEYVFASLSVE